LHLLNTTQIEIVAIAVLVYGKVEFNLWKHSAHTVPYPHERGNKPEKVSTEDAGRKPFP
jgi:hypothetical protein